MRQSQKFTGRRKKQTGKVEHGRVIMAPEEFQKLRRRPLVYPINTIKHPNGTISFKSRRVGPDNRRVLDEGPTARGRGKSRSEDERKGRRNRPTVVRKGKVIVVKKEFDKLEEPKPKLLGTVEGSMHRNGKPIQLAFFKDRRKGPRRKEYRGYKGRKGGPAPTEERIN